MPQKPCCYRAASDLSTGYCDECGAALLRCAAFEECGGLLDGGGVCGVCIAPQLILEDSRPARAGGALALPLLLTNRAQVGRPIFVHSAHVREGDGDWRPLSLGSDRIDAGASIPIVLRTSPLERSGSHAVEVALALASRWRWREEVFCFTAGVHVDVEAGGQVSVVQNISYDASAAQTGATIYAPLRLENNERAPSASGGPEPLTLTRADRLERAFGLRGGPDGNLVPRGARLVWRGFAGGDAPSDGPIVTSDGTLHLGRARTRASGGPNDVRLLVSDARGVIDEAASRAISRQHLCLSITGGRLVLFVESELGAWVDGVHAARGALVPLRDGSRIKPLPPSASPLELALRMEARYGVVESVEVTRLPRIEGAR